MSLFYQNPGIGPALESLGSTFGNVLQNVGQARYQQGLQNIERQRQKQTGSLLKDALSSLPPQASAQDILGALASVTAQTGESQMPTQFGNVFTNILRSQPKAPFGQKTKDELVELFKKFGMSSDVADRNAELFQSLTVGGQTAFAQQLIENIQRGHGNKGLFDIQDDFQEEITDPADSNANLEIKEDETFQFPVFDPFEGLTDREKVARQSELFKDNAKLFKDTQESLKGIKAANRSIRQLTNLNNSNKLPKGLEKLLKVNQKTGELRFPALANAETQLFVKTVNEFVKGAKEQFGARVSNFELDRFMQQLPTLANTEEGRRLILKQMELVNKLRELDDDSIKETYNHYGLRNIDQQQATQIADRFKSKKEQKLIDQLDRVVKENDIYLVKQRTPKGKIAVEVNGEYGFIDPSEKEEAIRKGVLIL